MIHQAETCNVTDLDQPTLELAIKIRAGRTCRAAVAFCKNMSNLASDSAESAFNQFNDGAKKWVTCTYSQAGQLIQAAIEPFSSTEEKPSIMRRTFEYWGVSDSIANRHQIKKGAVDVATMGTRIVTHSFDRFSQWLAEMNRVNPENTDL